MYQNQFIKITIIIFYPFVLTIFVLTTSLTNYWINKFLYFSILLFLFFNFCLFKLFKRQKTRGDEETNNRLEKSLISILIFFVFNMAIVYLLMFAQKFWL